MGGVNICCFICFVPSLVGLICAGPISAAYSFNICSSIYAAYSFNIVVYAAQNMLNIVVYAAQYMLNIVVYAAQYLQRIASIYAAYSFNPHTKERNRYVRYAFCLSSARSAR